MVPISIYLMDLSKLIIKFKATTLCAKKEQLENETTHRKLIYNCTQFFPELYVQRSLPMDK